MTALVIVTHNNADCLRRCLASARVLGGRGAIPVVVDNGSTQANLNAAIEALADTWGCRPQVVTPEEVQSGDLEPRPVVVTSRDNLGYARGNNLGVEAARTMIGVQYVLLANDDVIFTADIVPGLQRVLCEEEGCGVAGPVLYRPDMADIDHNCARMPEKASMMISDNFLKYWWRLRGMKRSPWQQRRYMLAGIGRDKWPRRLRVGMPSGACMMMRLDTFVDVGGFDERTFLYYEENILMEKLHRHGLHAVVDTTLGAVHLGAATTSQAPKSYEIMRESCRSQRLFVDKYTDAGPILRLFHRLSVFFLLASYGLQRAIAPGSTKNG